MPPPTNDDREELIYGARSLREQRRNQAQLGIRWQAKPLTAKEARRLPRYPEPLDTSVAWWQGFFWGWFCGR
jgi:hypothetical protein